MLTCIREQIAGDLLPEVLAERRERLTATGTLRHDYELQTRPS